jgi:predicted N-acyltransferase
MRIEARWLDRLADIPAQDWDRLPHGGNPFLRHAFLEGLERTGCLRREWGWTPHHLGLWGDGQLLAAAPGYLKDNSHGEFVFDHAWARAYAAHGLDYYPKWLGAVPYSPVTGARLLADDPALRQRLAHEIAEHVRALGLSSAHVNFLADAEAGALGPAWLRREDIQYHWHNAGPWQDFDQFLAAMDHKHRKNIRQERAKVLRAGVRFRRLHGDQASAADLDAIHHFYLRTFRDYGNAPALTREFIGHLARQMPGQVLLVLADLDGRPVAGALCLRSAHTLYGRYWGSDITLPGLHFETCYYQGIEYCLEHGLQAFEPGAQGEHKLARGFLPARVHSAHYVAHPAFQQALAGWCAEEVQVVRRHGLQLASHSPFKAG